MNRAGKFGTVTYICPRREQMLKGVEDIRPTSFQKTLRAINTNLYRIHTGENIAAMFYTA